MAPRELPLPGTWPTERIGTVDTNIVPTTGVVAAGDPFAYAGEKHYGCSWCFGGYITITVEEDGTEYEEAVPCGRCNREGL
jgi:hypothetical protein